MLCVARHQPAICESRSRASLVHSTTTARLWQRKGRCIRVKLACKMTRGPPRLHSPAFSRPSGVKRDTRRPLGTRRNACGCRRDICICPIKTGFDRSVGGAVWALTAYQTRETPPQKSSDHCATALHRCGCAEAKPRRLQSLCCSRQRAVAALTPPRRRRRRSRRSSVAPPSRRS